MIFYVSLLIKLISRMKQLLSKSCLLLAVLWAGVVSAVETFAVSEIRVQGLQRISEGTIFNYLPIEIGDELGDSKSAEIISTLYKTGFFKNIELLRDGSALIVKVLERPSIASISITGNSEISSEDLETGMENAGLTKGRILDISLLDRIELDLQQQYVIRGFYAVEIETEVTATGENQVDVKINIQEGEVALIRQVNIIGASNFDEDDLLDEFELGIPAFYSIFSSRDQYSKQKLAADIETLKSFYLDRGYINFNVVSTQVSITPEKKSVFITLNINEGEQFSISSIELAGDLIVPESELKALMNVEAGDTFSRRKVNAISSAISDRLGNEGYAFANVNAVPEINAENKQVSLTYFIDPGKRVYVRRINISGNEQTDDEVIRREFRQMEGAWLSTTKLNRSQVRVQRLGYLDQVTLETPLVPGSSDQVDVNMSVAERASGSLMLGVGYSGGGGGLLLNASVSQDNFLGSGERISVEVNTSKANKVYSFSHTNPYYTLDGVSRSIRVSYRQTDASQLNAANYIADVVGGTITYGIPMSEYDTVRLGVGYDNTAIQTTSRTPQSYLDFLEENADTFDVFKLSLSWSHDTRNRTVFATEGFVQTLSTDITIPVSKLNFYKVASRSRWFYALSKRMTTAVEAEINYGDSYGDTTELPFFERFYAGGTNSVRGYRSSTLGPRENGKALGGDFRVVGSAELIFMPPFTEESSTVRMSLFWDVGNVFDGIDYYNSAELRQSVGVSLIWLSPIGPLSFSLSNPLNDKPSDNTESFQFTLGSAF